MIRVGYFHRRFAGTYSIERQFNFVKAELSRDIYAEDIQVETSAGSIAGVLRNLIKMPTTAFDAYHVTGDVHYMVLWMPRKRTILTIHDCRSCLHYNRPKRFLYNLWWFKIPIITTRNITCVSEFTKREVVLKM